jgi:hypothetical protein
MTKQYDNTNRFVLYVNDRKAKDTDADRTGELDVEGRKFWLNGWLKKDKNGRQYLSGMVRPKEQPARSAQAVRSA